MELRGQGRSQMEFGNEGEMDDFAIVQVFFKGSPSPFDFAQGATCCRGWEGMVAILSL